MTMKVSFAIQSVERHPEPTVHMLLEFFQPRHVVGLVGVPKFTIKMNWPCR
jgi:hypothetical protein